MERLPTAVVGLDAAVDFVEFLLEVVESGLVGARLACVVFEKGLMQWNCSTYTTAVG